MKTYGREAYEMYTSGLANMVVIGLTVGIWYFLISSPLWFVYEYLGSAWAAIAFVAVAPLMMRVADDTVGCLIRLVVAKVYSKKGEEVEL